MQNDTFAGLRQLLWWAAGVGLATVVLVAALSSGQDVATILGIFSTRFLGIFIEAAPFLLLGTLASGLIEAFVTADDIARLIPRSKFVSPVVGAFLGFLFPVCECGVVPVVRRLFLKGLPMSVGVAFLLAAPVINPIVLVSTYVAFGVGPILIGRFALTVAVAIVVGWVFAFSARPEHVLRPASLVPVLGGSSNVLPLTRRKSFGVGLREALRTAGDEFFDMGRYLVLGTLLAATLQTLVSQDTLLALGRGPVVSVVVMQGLAFLLSVCSTVDSFLALAFVGTFTTGSILSFLVFGPMVDIKSTLMFGGIFKPRVVLYLILLPFLLTLLIGLWINLNLAL
jgi:uncharacterized membrane protein YraQ (UPF0718 family)